MNFPKVSLATLKGKAGPVVIAVGAVLGLLIVFRRPQSSTVAAPTGLDTAGEGSVLGTTGGALGGFGAGTGSSGSVDNTPGNYSTNLAWRRNVAKWLSQQGYSSLEADRAVALYLSGDQLTAQQQEMVNQALGYGGYPPYPPDPAETQIGTDPVANPVDPTPAPPVIPGITGIAPPVNDGPSALPAPVSVPTYTYGAAAPAGVLARIMTPVAESAPTIPGAYAAAATPAVVSPAAAPPPPAPEPAPEPPQASTTTYRPNPGGAVYPTENPSIGTIFVDPSWQGGDVTGVGYVPAA